MGELSRARDAVHAAAASDPTRTTPEDLDAALDAFAAMVRKYAYVDACNAIAEVETECAEHASEGTRTALAWCRSVVYGCLGA